MKPTAEETPLKIYVASSWREERQPVVVSALRDAGHDVYDFRSPAPGNHGFHWSDVDIDWEGWSCEELAVGLDHPIAERGFGFDMDAMRWADACVLVVPATAGRSSHLELGWCAGAGKTSVVLLPRKGEPELMYKIADKICTSIAGVLGFLDDISSTYRPADNLDPAPVGTYTWDALLELFAHWEIDGPFRELADGRIVLESWDPATEPSPTVLATRVPA